MIPLVYCERCKGIIADSTVYMAKADYQMLVSRAQEMKKKTDAAVEEATMLRSELAKSANKVNFNAANDLRLARFRQKTEDLKAAVSEKRITKDRLANLVQAFIKDVEAI